MQLDHASELGISHAGNIGVFGASERVELAVQGSALARPFAVGGFFPQNTGAGEGGQRGGGVIVQGSRNHAVLGVPESHDVRVPFFLSLEIVIQSLVFLLSSFLLVTTRQGEPEEGSEVAHLVAVVGGGE